MRMVSSVSILGAGPAGFALAADLQNHGTNTLLYSHRTHLRHAKAVMETGRLQLSCKMEGFTNLKLTTDIAEAVAFSKILILTVPSTGQLTLLNELRHYDLRFHTIIAIPGNLFSLLKEIDIEAENILETNLSPYSCRMEGDNLVVFGRKSVIHIAAQHTTAVRPGFREEIQSIFPSKLRWCDNVIEVCLANVNGVFHPLMMLMNAGRIEDTAGDFMLYRDGLTRSVANAMLAVDRVRMEVCTMFGLRAVSAIDLSNECYDQAFTDLVDLARNSPPHNKLRAPTGFENRNISEDVPDLLVSWQGLAEMVGVDASPIAAVIILAEMATGLNLRETGRGLDKLRLEGLGPGELTSAFNPYMTPPQTEARL
ncbi:NAD/NADP octopine/nopaline dehydrogenase [Colletotrichum graminicola]|uniref:NAD/NADP octopine/nopaline dehydrogenase n=1 Tax=Colletotrichum graminicola (strain M1.001 / M2 / FGSC 10212) TaxID=645133 RepID=E3QK24_COLGM|nr:NAD/NADP octopine/nopaline dehydrogenase [Colletotrichum graminicola M1.001]EFQ31212.1 NAD/NADP octopine/nopaline dehydrogenase [Colletotrichum graminicola M1.001]WDK19203.1 NAD/NADP octopine/nopaline dehydrogenase [Colletotrichum graminicola]